MKRLLALGLLAAACVMAQPNSAFYYDGSNRLQYLCESGAVSVPVTTTWQRSDSTLTNIVIASNIATFTTATAHQAYEGMRVTVVGSAAGALDGTFTIQSVASATTFTANITASDGTNTTSTLVVTTPNPLLNASVWSVSVNVYNAGGYLKAVFLAGGGKSLAHTMKCSDRTLY